MLPRSVLILTNIPNHYRIPLFNELSRQLDDLGFRLVVAFAAETYARRQAAGRQTTLETASFRWHILPSIELGQRQPIFLPRGLGDIVDEYRPSVLVAAGTGSLAVAGLIHSRRTQVPLLIWTGEYASGSGIVSSLRRVVKRHLLRRAAAVIVYGSAAAKWVRSMVPTARIYPAWNTVDIGPFLGVRPRPALERPVRFISIGDLSEYKGYKHLIMAISRLDMPPEQVRFLIVGDGPQKDVLTSMCTSLGLAETVQFLGRKPHTEIPSALSEADVFVLPSTEPWGLVLVEAMAAGLPAVASSRAGASHDLIVPGSGVVIDPDKIDDFSSALRAMVFVSADERRRMGERARQHVSELCNLQNSAAGFVFAIQDAIATTSPSGR